MTVEPPNYTALGRKGFLEEGTSKVRPEAKKRFQVKRPENRAQADMRGKQ